MATTAGTIIRTAFADIGVLGEGQTLDSAKAADGLHRLNLMMSSLSIQPMSIPVIAREVFDMTSGKGSPTNPYTIGVGANLDTARPPTQNSIVGVGLILTASDPDVEIPRTYYTDDAYQAIQIKDLDSSLFTGLYYNPTFETTGFGNVFLWPVPDTADNDLVLYLRKQLTSFADQTTSYELPPGCEDALTDGLAVRLCKPYSVPVDPDLKAAAGRSMGNFKRGNYHLVDLQQDPAMTHSRRYGYNINSGNG
jgi:hypothetical protein